MSQEPQIHPVDQILPARKLIPFGFQHVLVMAASPITSAFLVSKALNLSPDLTVKLISATLLVCGIGSVLQWRGPSEVGGRSPLTMVSGGAPSGAFPSVGREAGS